MDAFQIVSWVIQKCFKHSFVLKLKNNNHFHLVTWGMNNTATKEKFLIHQKVSIFIFYHLQVAIGNLHSRPRKSKVESMLEKLSGEKSLRPPEKI